MCCSLQLAAVAFLAATGAVQATAGWLAADAVKLLITVVAVAAPAGQALERGLGGLPVAAAARRLPARLGAQQPLRINRVPPIGRHHQPSPAVASARGSALRL
jgi:hypothetical protein